MVGGQSLGGGALWLGSEVTTYGFGKNSGVFVWVSEESTDCKSILALQILALVGLGCFVSFCSLLSQRWESKVATTV